MAKHPFELKQFATEAQFQRFVESLAAMHGVRAFHVADSRRAINDRGRTRFVGDHGIAGFPDLVLVKVRFGELEPARLAAGCSCGVKVTASRILYRELKLNGKYPTALQREVLEQLRAAGADADVWRPADLGPDGNGGRILEELRAL